VVPHKRRRGFDDREIEALLVNNPARLLTSENGTEADAMNDERRERGEKK